MKQNRLALTLTFAIASSLGLYLWHEHENSRAASTAPSPSNAQARPSTAIAPDPGGEKARTRPPLAQKRHANGLYRCNLAGSVSYQDHACPGGAMQAEVRNGSVSVVDRIIPVALTSDSPRSDREKVGRITRTEQPWFGETNADECAALRRRIARIDEAARRRSTAQLTEERRKAVRRKYDLGCSEFD